MDILLNIAAEKKIRTVIRNLLRQTSYSVEEIAKFTDVPVEWVKDVKKNMRKKK